MKYRKTQQKPIKTRKNKRTKKGGSGSEIINSKWDYKKTCEPPKKICDKRKINFALCVEDEADCDNPDYDYHFYKSKDGEKDAIKINTFNVERFKVIPNDDLSEKEKEAIQNDVLRQEVIGRFKSYVPEFMPTSCYVQKKNSASRLYASNGEANTVPPDFSIVTQNALGLYFGKPEEELDEGNPIDAKNKAILNIMRLRTAYFRRFLLESECPDFLCFQEMTPEFLRFLYSESELMREKYKYVYPDKENFDKLITRKAEAITLLISKYPAIKHTTYMLQGNSSYYNSLSVTEFNNLVIFNVYLQAGSKFSPGMKYNWENYSRCRRQQLIFIKSLIDSYAHEKAVIVLGDFNFELNSIHCDGTPDDTENWSELTFLKALNLKDSFKTLHPDEPGLTENTEINTLRFLGKLEHKSFRYDGIFFNEKLSPVISAVVNNVPLKINEANKGALEIPFEPEQINKDYELALVFRPGGDESSNDKLERYKEEYDLNAGYELFVSDHFGVMTKFRFNNIPAGGKNKKRRTKRRSHKRKQTTRRR
jgi:hypothetical protein